MTDTRGAAAEPASAATATRVSDDLVDSRPRISAAFASALAGAALIVGTVVTIVIVVSATSGG